MVFPTHWEESLLFLGLEKAAPPQKKRLEHHPGSEEPGMLACSGHVPLT